MTKLISVVILLSMLLTGCTQAPTTAQTQPRLVTMITADYSSGVIELHRQYTDCEKMRAVLNYFRGLHPGETVPSAPAEDSGSRISVTLTYSDGSTKTYDQRADQYLRQGSGSWQTISADKGRELAMLLGLMESD